MLFAVKNLVNKASKKQEFFFKMLMSTVSFCLTLSATSALLLYLRGRGTFEKELQLRSGEGSIQLRTQQCKNKLEYLEEFLWTAGN